MFNRSVRATRIEKTRRLAGDDLISNPGGSFTHAVTVRRPVHEVWQWLAQMGAGIRAGWYSYDFIDNGGARSADRIVPELQDIAVGMVFPALPGISEGFVVAAYRMDEFLVLAWPRPDGTFMVSWSFVLERLSADLTRVIVRVRGARDYRFRRIPAWLNTTLVSWGHSIMQRRQLLGLAERAEHGSRA